DLAKTVLAPALRLIIDFTGILNGQHMPALCGRRHEHRPVRYHVLDRDRIVRQKALKPRLFGPVICQIADTNRLPFAHALNDKFAIPCQTLIAEITNSLLHRRLPNRITTGHTESQQILSFQIESHCNIIDSHRTKLTRTATSVRKLAPKGRGGPPCSL